MNARNQIISFPSKILTISVFFTLLCLGILSIYITKSYALLGRLIKQDMIITQTAEQIIYYDEVLTMSARLAANPKQDTKHWETRYRKYEKLLDASIHKILDTASIFDYDVSPITQTDIANQKLINMENQSFALSLEKKYDEARSVLFSTDYKANKTLYSKSIAKIAKNIRQRLQLLLQEAQKELFLAKIIVLFGSLFLITIWVYTITQIRHWHRSTKQAFLDAISSKEKLEKNSRELEEKNHELARFNFIVAHDLKESLRSIFSFSQLAYKEVQNDSLKDYLQRIQNSCQSMRELIEGLLSYAKLDDGNEKLENVDLTNLIDQLQSDTLSGLLRLENAKIYYQELQKLHTNKTKIIQIFSNLITNGLTYNSSDTPTITIKGKKEGKYYLISFKDNGIGIEKEYQTSIFELFTRLHDKRTYRGSGLGLSICRKAIESLGGNIWLEKSSTSGSTFIVRFPASILQKSEYQDLKFAT